MRHLPSRPGRSEESRERPDLGRLVLLVSAGVALVLASTKLSDFGLILRRDGPNEPVEWLPLVRGSWTPLHAVTDDPVRLAQLTAVLGGGGALATFALVRRFGGRAGLLIGPSLLLVGQNLDSWLGALVAAAAVGSVGASVLAGAAKVVPGAGTVALLARRPRRWPAALGAATVSLGIPLLIEPDLVTEPFRIAADRTDPGTTIWAVLFGHDAHLTWQPLALTLVLVVLVATIGRSHLSEAGAVAFTVLGAMMLNKVWQPHYVLWAMPALAMTPVDRRAVRALELSSLVVFLVIWSDFRTPAWEAAAGAVRFLAAAAVLASLWQRERAQPQHPGPRDAATSLGGVTSPIGPE